MGQLQFKNDRRLTFQEPKSRQVVHVPVTVRWSMKNFDAVGLDGPGNSHRGVFAVFVDGAPMPVGENLKWLARGDNACKRDPRCPSAQYLAERGVYVTTETSVKLDVLPNAGAGRGVEQHYLNVVLLDGTGRRIGESAWYLPFRSRRRLSP
jgi:hypothetical protein